MKKDPEVFIGHILELIESYASNLTSKTFRTNMAMQDAIIRRLEIIGEAVKNIPLTFRTKHPDIPWKKQATIELSSSNPCETSIKCKPFYNVTDILALKLRFWTGVEIYALFTDFKKKLTRCATFYCSPPGCIYGGILTQGVALGYWNLSP